MKKEAIAMNRASRKAQVLLSRYLRKCGIWNGKGSMKKREIPQHFAENPIINGLKYASSYQNINHRLLDILAKINGEKYIPDGKPAQISRIRFGERDIQLKQKHNSIDVTNNEFLESYAWRKLRLQVIEAYGRKCMCCGNTPENGAIIHVDHIKPRKKYPELALEFDNLQVLCHECNHGKGNWNETDFRKNPVSIHDTV